MSGHVSDPCFREIPPSGLKIPLIIEVEILHSAADHMHTYIKMITFLLYMILIYIDIYILYIYWYSLQVFNGKDILPNSFNRLSKIWLKDSHHKETTGHDGKSLQLLPCLFHLFGGYSLCAEHPEFTVPPAASLEAPVDGIPVVTTVMFLTTWGSEEMQGGRSKYIQIPSTVVEGKLASLIFNGFVGPICPQWEVGP